jgi:segregation and condensation protein B
MQDNTPQTPDTLEPTPELFAEEAILATLSDDLTEAPLTEEPALETPEEVLSEAEAEALPAPDATLSDDLTEAPLTEEPALEAPEEVLSEAEAEAAVQSMTAGIEALVFASGSPISRTDVRKAFMATWRDFSEERQAAFGALFNKAFTAFTRRWGEESNVQGFELMEIGGEWGFRTVPAHVDLIKVLRSEKPARLSRAALEVLSIVAYRQPTTKAEVDYVRGVDCGGTLRGLLDRSLIKIVGKKDEPGRPLLYGTTHRFLSLFNLGTLRQLPTLREYHELSEDSAEKLREFDGFPSIDELTEDISPIEEHDDTVADDLETAVEALGESENATRDALAAEGITLEDADERG